MRKYTSLKSSFDFKAVYKTHNSLADKYLVMYVLENGLQKNRVGISASKKVGNSVVRHTLTRRVREAYRLQEESFRTGYDIVFVVRAAAAGCRQSDIEYSVHRLADRNRVLIQSAKEESI